MRHGIVVQYKERRGLHLLVHQFMYIYICLETVRDRVQSGVPHLGCIMQGFKSLQRRRRAVSVSVTTCPSTLPLPPTYSPAYARTSNQQLFLNFILQTPKGRREYVLRGRDVYENTRPVLPLRQFSDRTRPRD